VYHTYKSHISYYFHATLQLHNSPVNCVRELFKPSKYVASLLVCNEKKLLVLGSRFFVGNITSGVGFWLFWLILFDPGPNHKREYFAKIFIGNLARI